jgi:5'(3')-deoxyribonucleotidase
MRVGVDLDGVTYDFAGAYKRFAEIVEGHELPYPAGWDFPENQWGWTTEKYLDVFGHSVLEGNVFWRGKPIEGAKEGIAKLRELGHEVVIVTHRDHPDPKVADAMKRATLYWLQNHNIQVDAILFKGVKTNLGIDILVDDAPHNIEAATEAGEWVITFDQPWNAPRHLSEQAQDRSFRAVGWSEVVRSVEAHQGILDRAEARRLAGWPA